MVIISTEGLCPNGRKYIEFTPFEVTFLTGNTLPLPAKSIPQVNDIFINSLSGYGVVRVNEDFQLDDSLMVNSQLLQSEALGNTSIASTTTSGIVTCKSYSMA